MVRMTVYKFDQEPAPKSSALQEEIEGWRNRINQEFGAVLPSSLSWDEASTFSAAASPDFEALKLWIASLDNPDFKVTPNWHAIQMPTFPARTVDRFSHIFQAPDFWLPAEFEFSIDTNDPKGKSATLRSTLSLMRQLNDLNELSWKASPDEVEDWSLVKPGIGSSLENAAKYSFCEAFLAARYACDKHLPMKLDA